MSRSERPDLRAAFLDPPAEHGLIPFWFWNDDLSEPELLRQLGELHAAGFGGVLIHARTGLSRRVGYLTEEWFRLVRVVVDQAARLGMKVVLYDEAAYPSGSAAGRVVAENPAFASRCLIPVTKVIRGPARGFWRPSPGRALADTLVAVTQARLLDAERIDPESLRLLDVTGPGLVFYDVPGGEHLLASVWAVYSGATIRGPFEEEDDGHALAPAAGDIMSPEAVACFLRHTHEQYLRHLGDHFGTTIVAMFTDEPNPLGRSPRRGPRPHPYTPGLLDDLAGMWPAHVRTWLAALWFDAGPRGEDFRAAYRRAVAARIRHVFYTAQSRWCEEHGIALTGHPSASNEMGTLRLFHWPGQDMVWRYVEPGKETAVEGAHSLAPRAATSAASLWGRPRAAMELFGAYGWKLSADEMKWLLDWNFARGINLVFPHACFYSLRGRRAYESEPDVGLHNTLWPAVRLLARYARRMCWALSGGREVCETAVLVDPESMAWGASRVLTEHQIGHLFVGSDALSEASARDGVLRIGTGAFRAVVVDVPLPLDARLSADLDRLTDDGVAVLREWNAHTLVEALLHHVRPSLRWCGADGSTLRALHYRKPEAELFLLSNEGEGSVDGEAALQPAADHDGTAPLERWDAWRGTTEALEVSREGGSLRAHVRLERRETTILALLSPAPGAAPSVLAARAGPGPVLRSIDGPWIPFDTRGSRAGVPAPGDWAREAGWETFSGTVVYRATPELSAPEAERGAYLDLGAVGEIAEVTINSAPAGVAAWAPYVLRVSGLLEPGPNRIEVRVTNGMANAMDGLQIPSGLIGPVVLREAGR